MSHSWQLTAAPCASPERTAKWSVYNRYFFFFWKGSVTTEVDQQKPKTDKGQGTTKGEGPKEKWAGGTRRQSTTKEMWTQLRVATFGAIWRVRAQVLAGRRWPLSAPRQAALMAAEAVSTSVKRDWMRARQDVRVLGTGTFCADWWRGRDPASLRRNSAISGCEATPPYFAALRAGIWSCG